MTRITRTALRRIALLAGAATITAAAVQGAPRSSIHPYLEIQNVLNADLNGGDVLTYTAIGAGINAAIATRRVKATIGYNYQRRIAHQGDLADENVHSGIAAAQVAVVPGLLNFDAGALATRSQGDIRSPSAAFSTDDDPSAVDVYSVYAGPSLSTRAGPVALNATYRIGYVKLDYDSLAGGTAGQPSLERFDSSTIQSATVSAGMSPGELPFGWTVGAGWQREDQEALDTEFEGKYVRGDVVLPVSPKLALTAGVGYEEFDSSQQDFLRDASGAPLVDARGQLIPDPTRPRLLAYDQSGFIYDAGVIWRPSPRTELQARVGRRYGGTTFTGSLQHRINSAYALSASVYDSVSTFGNLLVADLAGVPRAFDTARLNRGLTGVNGCVLGTDPGTGACFDDTLSSINAFTFRNRGASILLSGGRGPWSYGLGASYDQRRYFVPQFAGGAVLDPVTDRSYSLQASAGRRLTRSSGFDLNAYASWYESGVQGTGSASTIGAAGSYYRNILNERLRANIAAGIYNVDGDGADGTAASILFGLRYSF